MPKGILEFNLPEEDPEFADATNGSLYKFALSDIDQLLRNAMKYGCDQCEDNKYSAFEFIRKELHDILETRNLNIE
jgi:hypothetical protein